MNQPDLTFGGLLRRHRLFAGLSQGGLAERAGVSLNAVGTLERGINRQPYPRTVALLADALGLPTEQRVEFVRASRSNGTGGADRLATVGTRRREDKEVAPLRSHVPTSATSLVGREQDVVAVREWLLGTKVRLVTLTGPGGTGKTRLALAVAANLADAFADGVHFVDLSPIRDPGLVHAAIAHTLGIRDAGDQPLLETLTLYLQPRCLFLVLDNFEQVIDAAALLPDLLAACPAVKILVTSREPLHLSWEHTWPVPPLALPPATVGADRDLISRSTAVALFVERARASRPDFALTTENARIVADICVRLDGLPLAIELAAARVPLLPLAAIHARLQQRLSLLTGGPRDAPVRHHTLRAAVAWSYGLLSQAEQTTFRRLCIFVGGFTIEAAAAVATVGIGDRVTVQPMKGSEALSARDEETLRHPIADSRHPNLTDRTFDLLSSLVDKNLLRSDLAGQGEPRFQLLETIREFGLEQLSARGELEAVQERHARFCLALAEEGDRSLIERVQRTWLDRLEAEYDNLHAALDWSLTAPEGADIGARLATAMALYWRVRGHFSTGRAWLGRVLAQEEGESLAPQMRVRVLSAASFLAARQGDFEAARALSDQGIALAQNYAGPGELATCLFVRGFTACHQAQFATAHEVLARGLEVARDSGTERHRAWILGVSSLLAYFEGDYGRARAYGEESLRILRERSELYGITMTLDTLGCVARRQGDYRHAQSLHEESLAASEALGDTWATAVSLAGLGHVARALGDDIVSRAHYTESLRIDREVGDRRGMALTLGNLGILARRSGDLDRARDFLSESLAAARVVGDKRNMAAALGQLASLARLQGDQPTAIAGYTESLQLTADLRDKRGAASNLEGCAELLLSTGRPAAALELCMLADVLLDSLGARRSPADHARSQALQAQVRGALSPADLAAIGPVAGDLDLGEVVEHALALLESKPTTPKALPLLADPDVNPLSRREREIATLIARGLTNRAIAEHLVIAERTADTHVSNILAKLGLRTRSQIAAWAAEHHLAQT